jgi:plasmid maintenance system antidote protein VapI
MAVTVDQGQILTGGEVARLLGRSESRVRQLVEAGELTPILRTRLGNLYDATTVVSFKAEREARRATKLAGE